MANNPVPSDVRSGTSTCLFISFFTAVSYLIIIDHGDRLPAPPCSVRIPYSCVPNLDISSRAYHKAISTLAKQVHHDKHNLKTCSDASFPVLMEVGMS